MSCFTCGVCLCLCLVLFASCRQFPVLQNSFSALACSSYSIRHAHLIHSYPRTLSLILLSRALDFIWSTFVGCSSCWCLHCCYTLRTQLLVDSHDASRGPGWPLHVLAVTSQPHLKPILADNGPLAPDATTSPSPRSFSFSYLSFRGFL